MNAYYDTGVLLPLYVKEVFSDAIAGLAESRHEAIPFNLFQQLEMETAIRLKLFRGEIDSPRVQAIIANRDEDMRSGRLVLRSVDWIRAMEEARRLGAQATGRHGCRTLDLVHVAIAIQWKCGVFVTTDDRQLKAARSAGLKTIDVRTSERPGRRGGAQSEPPTGTVQEKRARYGSVKRRRSAGSK